MLSFGKYSGLQLSYVMKNDPNYIEYLRSKGKDIVVTAGVASLSNADPGKCTINFGPYKDRDLDYIYTADPEYLAFLCSVKKDNVPRYKITRDIVRLFKAKDAPTPDSVAECALFYKL